MLQGLQWACGRKPWQFMQYLFPQGARIKTSYVQGRDARCKGVEPLAQKKPRLERGRKRFQAWFRRWGWSGLRQLWTLSRFHFLFNVA